MDLLRDELRVRRDRPVLTYYLTKRLRGNAVGSQDVVGRDPPWMASDERREKVEDSSRASVLESGRRYKAEDTSPVGNGNCLFLWQLKLCLL